MFVPDELFGQCLTQRQERFRYRVTAVLLDRLQSLLQTLMKEGEFHMQILKFSFSGNGISFSTFPAYKK